MRTLVSVSLPRWVLVALIFFNMGVSLVLGMFLVPQQQQILIQQKEILNKLHQQEKDINNNKKVLDQVAP